MLLPIWKGKTTHPIALLLNLGHTLLHLFDLSLHPLLRLASLFLPTLAFADRRLGLFDALVVLKPVPRDDEFAEPFEFARRLLELEKDALFLAEAVEFRNDLFLEERLDLFELLLFLAHRLDRLVLLLLEHRGSRRLLDHREDLDGSHVQDFGDLACEIQPVSLGASCNGGETATNPA